LQPAGNRARTTTAASAIVDLVCMSSPCRR
jgi:hypothetical protein